jgi:hypothetical protein
MAIVLRKAILETTEGGVKGQMLIHLPPFDTQFKDTPDSHVALSTGAGHATVVAVPVFDLMSGLIVVTEQPNRYPQTHRGSLLYLRSDDRCVTRWQLCERGREACDARPRLNVKTRWTPSLAIAHCRLA